MRRTLLLAAGLALATTACQEQITQPDSSELETRSAVMSSTAMERLSPLPLLGEGLSDARSIDLADRAIDPGDYSCPASTPVIDLLFASIDQLFAEEFDVYVTVASNAMDIVPIYEALVFAEPSKSDEYGYHGDFTNAMNRTEKDIRRFWDIDSDAIQVVPAKGTVFLDVDRVAATYASPLVFGLPPAVAMQLAQEDLAAIQASTLLNGGNHPLLSFNAVAFSGGFGIPPKVIMGDGILEAYADLGFGDVAPQAIFGHEWGHQVQYAKGYFADPIPSLYPPANAAEATRYTELMADAMSAYFLTHKRGATMNQKRVAQFLEVFYQIGDCSYFSSGHHGTPNQRLRAAQFGFDLADQAQKNGHIMTADEFHDLFVANYLSFIAPDAP